MSRSYRRPYGTYCSIGGSAKKDKQLAHRGVRRKQNAYIKNLTEFDECLIPHFRECAYNNVYDWCRDGNQFLMMPSKRDWYDYARYLNGDFHDEFDRKWLEKHDSVWPPEWWVIAQRK